MKIHNKEYQEAHRAGMLTAIHVLRNLSPDGVDFSEAAKFLEDTKKSIDIAMESIDIAMESIDIAMESIDIAMESMSKIMGRLE